VSRAPFFFLSACPAADGEDGHAKVLLKYAEESLKHAKADHADGAAYLTPFTT
jgi:hypothetical protein